MKTILLGDLIVLSQVINIVYEAAIKIVDEVFVTLSKGYLIIDHETLCSFDDFDKYLQIFIYDIYSLLDVAELKLSRE